MDTTDGASVSNISSHEKAKSVAAVSLMKGPVYRERSPDVWSILLNQQAQIIDYMAVLGLRLHLDEAEGYAYLRSQSDEELEYGDLKIPRLVARRQLTYQVSLLLALLRRRMAEHETQNVDEKLIITKEGIIELIRTFLPDSSNEAKVVDRIDSYIEKTVKLGFLRKITKQKDTYEVCRILKSFVDAEWLNCFEEKLQEYKTQIAGEAQEDDGL